MSDLVIGYVRVSSIEQESGFGPDVQEQAIRAFCQMRKLGKPTIVHESKSGEGLIERHEFRLILAQLKEHVTEGKGKAAVVFARLDRLSRTLTDQESVVLAALHYGYRLHCCNAAEDDLLSPGYAGDPMRVAIRQVLGTFAQLERATIQGRLDGGLYAKAKEGGHTGGRVPFGYKGVDQDIVVDEEAKPAVIQVFRLHAKGVIHSVIAGLMARDFPRLCGHWQQTQVTRVLARVALYSRGLYKPRLAVEPVERLDLIILPDDVAASRFTPDEVDSSKVDWSRYPDPVPMNSLALILRTPASWLQKYITDHDLATTWHKSRQMVPHATARALEKLVRVQRESKQTA
jgi:site-specific DNA recombinase